MSSGFIAVIGSRRSMMTKSEKLCVELEGLMAEKQELDYKIADTLCKVHRYLTEEGKGESAG
jgi:hypothetical protein